MTDYIENVKQTKSRKYSGKNYFKALNMKFIYRPENFLNLNKCLET